MEIINIKCGEIYLSKNSSYYFHCIHCEETFYSLEIFKKHNLNHFIIDVNNVSNTIGEGIENSYLKAQNTNNVDFQNIEVLEPIEIQEDYTTKIGETKNNFETNNLKSKIETSGFEVIDSNLIDEFSGEYSTISNLKIEREDSKGEDDNNYESNTIKFVKIEHDSDENNTESFCNEKEYDTTIVYCCHCELSFTNSKIHDLDQCEIIQKKILKYNRNLNFLKADGIYLCEYCPRYYETNRKLQNHQNKHYDIKSEVRKNKNRVIYNEIVIDHEISYDKSIDNAKDLVQCEMSVKNFDNKNDYLNHMTFYDQPETEQILEDNNIDDGKIQDNFFSGKEYNPEIEPKKKEENSIKCPHCNVVFKNFQNHDVNKCLKVQQVKKKCKNNYEILQKKGIFLCQECPRYFDDEIELIFHRKKQHYFNGRCPVCLESFEKLDIIEHIRNVHAEITIEELLKKSKPNELHECSYCKRKFVLKTYLKRHLKIHENNELQCKFCNKICQSQIILKNHLRTHTGERPFVCQQCPAAFSLKHNLDLHFIYKHTDDRPFKCQYEGGCGKSFKTKQLKNYHERRHTGEILRKCEICGTEYRNKSAFSKHMKIRHMNYNERPYQCEYCDKKFVEYGRLREHIRTHTGEKPLQCDVCLKSFARNSVLREHKKLHTGIKNHVCSICGKAFAQTAGYFNHLKYHS